MKRIFFVFSVLIAYTVVGQDQWKNVYKESAWKERDEWQRPADLIKYLNLHTGSHVADIGSHEGYMTIKLSTEVSGKGKVYAVDVDQSKLNALKDHLTARGITNVTAVKGDYDDPKLPSNELDGVIILDTYHEMDDHDTILVKVRTALKSGGRLVICEPIEETRRKLSRKQQEDRHEIGINFVLEDLRKAGFDIVYQKDPFVDRSEAKGDMMWIIVATKK